MAHTKKIVIVVLCILFNAIEISYAQLDLSTKYFKVHIDEKGFITSMKNVVAKPYREFSATSKKSPLLCLYNSKKDKYYLPLSTRYNSAKRELLLTYANGSKAKVLVETKNEKYFKFELVINNSIIF